MADLTGVVEPDQDHELLVVIGLGYVGLPLAIEATKAGMTVIGYDLNPSVVADLNSGISHIDDVSDADVATALRQRFSASIDPSVIGVATTVVICVPTPLSESGGPDLSAVEGAARCVADNLAAGSLVVLESTTYPGTTDDFLVPLLEASGLRAGFDFGVAFSPERVDPGNPVFGIKNTPKVVGGFTDTCTKAAVSFYSRFVDTVVVARGTKEAEMAKLLENTYRHVNIALVNEMACFSHELGIDLWDVIRCASTKPFGFQAFRPGPGVGGHCIPIDPNYLSHAVKSRLNYPFRFVELAQEINNSMPLYVVRRAQDILNTEGLAVNGAKILLLGVTYKPNIADHRESPAFPIARKLLDMGALVSYQDPYLPEWAPHGVALHSEIDLDLAVADADLTILLQPHRAYDVEHLATLAQSMFDTQGVLQHGQVHGL